MKLTNKFETALIYATRLHANQRRKAGDVPYIAHLLSVAALVLEAGGNEDEAIAALLHDGVEDQGGEPTRQEILSTFGETVTAIVDGCTESNVTPKPPWRDRKLKYLENLRHGSPSVRLVSLADKLHNARSLLVQWQLQGDAVWNHFTGSPQDKLWFYQELLKIYQSTGSDFMTIELQQLVKLMSQKLEIH